jgi:flagellar motor switch protein FliN/FliY
MDEEKNELDLPQNDASSDDEKEDIGQNEGAAAEESPPDMTPEEKEMLEKAGESLDSIENESENQSDNPDGKVEDDGSSEAAESSNGIDHMLSQDEIDNALGKMADQMNNPLPDMGSLENDETNIKQADFQQLSSSSDTDEPRNIDLLMDVDLPVSIELGHTRMRISDILALGPGSIVELDKLVGEPVDLLVNQKCVARGEVVVVEESFGLRITMLVSPEERLKNLQ